MSNSVTVLCDHIYRHYLPCGGGTHCSCNGCSWCYRWTYQCYCLWTCSGKLTGFYSQSQILHVYMHSQQIYKRDTEFNTNEIANGVLACLVAVTGCCPFIDPLWAILIGRKFCDVISAVCVSVVSKHMYMCPPVLCSSHHPLLSRWMLYGLPAGHSGWSKDISFARNMVQYMRT